MKVLMVGSLPGPGTGGVATAVANLCRSLAELENVDVHLYADNKCCNDLSEWQTRVDSYHVYTPLCSTLSNIGSYTRLFGLLGVFITHLIRGFYKLKGDYWNRSVLSYYFHHYLYLKHIIDTIQPDVIHAQHAHARPITSWLACEGKVPIIVTLQSFHALLGTRKSERKNREAVFRRNFELCSGIIAVSEFVRQQALELGAPGEKLIVIPNGVDVDVFSPISPKQQSNSIGEEYKGCKLVLFTGSLIKRKGVDVLIQAFSKIANRVPESRLLLVGDGPERETLRILADRMVSGGRVVFVGRKSLSEIPPYYQASYIFALPSMSEGLSLSLLEAMASSLPVITTFPDKGCYDAVIDGETGFLVHYGDVGELANSMEILLRDEELAQQVGHNARGFVVKHFSWEKIAKCTYDLYLDILGGRGKITDDSK